MFNLPTGVNFVNMFGMPQNRCIQRLFCINFIFLLTYCLQITCIFSITNLCLQVVVKSVLFDKNSIMLAVRILIQGKYGLYFIMVLIK